MADKYNIYFFLPATIDRSEKISRYFNSVKLSPIDIDENSFAICKDGISFDLSKLDIGCQQKTIITETTVKKMKLILSATHSVFCQEKNEMTTTVTICGFIMTTNSL